MKPNAEKSVSQKIRALIERGHSNKYIVEKLQCNPRTVYNIRYRVNKDRGIAALGKAAPKRAPAVKKFVPTVVADDTPVDGTGINEPPSIEFVGPEPFQFSNLDYAIAVVFAMFVVACYCYLIWGRT